MTQPPEVPRRPGPGSNDGQQWNAPPPGYQPQPQYPPPGYRQPPAPPGYGTQGYEPPQQPPSKPWYRKTWVIVVGVILVVIIIATAANSGKKKGNDAASNPPAAGGSSPQAQTSATHTSTHASATHHAKPKSAPVVLKAHGSGGLNTRDFTVTHSQWQIKYSFDCSNFGSTGNFQIYVQDSSGTPSDIAVNELKSRDKGSTYEHGTGKYNLEINSECDWHVKVTG